ncbi:Wzz/FepE/Etk N-terminal domain-containing protein [Hydrogenimonas urashimensis]|uniref:Wzz/FepE/Etk N-terminal domain-containing protein n=1 Tax=Hydrogenimonas urashimensis TaxID=2740515 RepID=UPI001915F60D|nr:Wzz/FepE/Etk N-terminal domain-containing protein [Hydrogenimonas urashimensis]
MNEKKNPSENEPQIVMPYGYMPYCLPEEEKIDLRELWEILKRRKKTVWLTTLLFGILAGIYLLFAQPIYEAKATIAIGKQLVKKSDGTLETKYFDNATTLKKMLDVKYDTAGKYRDDNVTTYVASVEVPKKTENFLTITAAGPGNKEAVAMLKKPIDEILSKHQVYMQSILDVAKHKMETLSEQLEYYKTIELTRLKKELDLVQKIDLKKIDDKIALIKETQIPALQQKIDESKKEIEEKKKNIADLQRKVDETARKDPALAAMTSMQLANLQNDVVRLSMKIIDYRSKIKELRKITIPNLEKEKKKIVEKILPAKKAAIKKLESMTIPQLESEIDELKVSMKPPYIEQTAIVGKIFTHDHPAKPKKKLILAVSLITGLMLGVFLAFFLEFLGKEK